MGSTQLLSWDGQGTHKFETGVDHCVLYLLKKVSNVLKYTNGVAWMGISAINENPSGADATKIYADNIKYLNLYSAEEFGATIEAYTYPDEWGECDGSAEMTDGMVVGQQSRATFGLCYRTKLGDDVDGDAAGYKLHLVYGCQASVSPRQYQTTNESPNANTMSWEITTTPVSIASITVDGVLKEFKPTSIITVDSTKFTGDDTKKGYLAALEAVLYGSVTDDDVPVITPAELPTPDEVYLLLTTGSRTPAS